MVESSNKAYHDDFGLEESDQKQVLNEETKERLKKQSSYTYWVQNNQEQFP